MDNRGALFRPFLTLSSLSCHFLLTRVPQEGILSIIDLLDQHILSLLQADSSLSVREIGEEVGLTPTPCWRRIQNLESAGVIKARVALLEPTAINLNVIALVQIRTSDHSASWLDDFRTAIDSLPEIVEAHRTSGETDYMLKVVVPDIAAYDAFYKRLIEFVDLLDVRSTFVMEELKHTTSLPLGYIDS